MSAADVTALSAVIVGEPDQVIVALEARIRAAQLAADLDELSALISEELLFTGPDGQLGTKAQDLNAHASGLVRFLRHEPRELRIRRIGTSAAVTSLLADLAVSVQGVVHTGRYRYTRIWAQEHDRPWQVVGGHVSQLPGQDPNDE